MDSLFKGGTHSILQITILTFKNLFFIVFTESVIFLCTLLFLEKLLGGGRVPPSPLSVTPVRSSEILLRTLKLRLRDNVLVTTRPLYCHLAVTASDGARVLPIWYDLHKWPSLTSCDVSPETKDNSSAGTALPVVMYGCETWSLILREGHKLRVFENKTLRNIFWDKRREITWEWTK